MVAMETKIKHFPVFLIFLLLRFASGEVQRLINGIINESVTLPSGSPYTSPSKVLWSINNRATASYFKVAPPVQTDRKRFGDRLRLNTEDGSLQINQVKMEDAATYVVEVSHEKKKHTAEVKLMIYEKADTPILEVLSNTSGPGVCNVSVKCTTRNNLQVESFCELKLGKFMCQERNVSTPSASLLITVTKDAINCSSSNPASTSSAPLIPLTHVCPPYVPGPPILEVLSNISGPGFCNVTVKCALRDLHLESICELAQGKLMCQEMNASTHSVLLLITATKDAISCSSSNLASTSPTPLLSLTHVCPPYEPGLDYKHGLSQRSRITLFFVGSFVLLIALSVLFGVYKKTQKGGN